MSTERARAAAPGSGPPTATEQIRYRDVRGERWETSMTIGSTRPSRSVLEVRDVRVDGVDLIQRRVPESLGALEHDAYARLESEVRALARLEQVFRRVPDRLPTVHGYNVDAREPFVLVAPGRGGRPAAEVVGKLDVQERAWFQQSLLRVVSHLRQADIEHNDITLAALDWNGADVRLVSFERAAIVRDPGDGDLQAAARIMRQLHRGPRATSDPERDPDALRDILRGLEDPDPRRRPSVETLLERLHARDEQLATRNPVEPLMAGWDEFDRRNARKHGRPAPRRTSREAWVDPLADDAGTPDAEEQPAGSPTERVAGPARQTDPKAQAALPSLGLVVAAVVVVALIVLVVATLLQGGLL